MAKPASKAEKRSSSRSTKRAKKVKKSGVKKRSGKLNRKTRTQDPLPGDPFEL
jgi:hypothetical protein